ncbi:PAS domain-containing protein [Lysinibacillus antri]|uniref:PAS domain-containing protein n=1 Tax=Lysinibacillus antri TaxID=2498145 RepID=A0A3S0WHA7_9BACI|nr:PAS domain-containing protein [Lysinibacillus antri]RUL54298.1 hypothetical protein EK386_07280 [Lysinibacillus antri]
MVKTVSPIFRKLFQTVQDPVLILNTSCQIESINDCAAQLLNINIKQNNQLSLDEQSEVRWSAFVNRIRMDMGGFCLLRVRVNEVQYKEIKLAGYYHEKKI